jgi:hypothetical protein
VTGCLYSEADVEEAVYVCGWREGQDGLSAWVKSHPEVRGHGSDRTSAFMALSEAIRDAGGALHAALEFDPPLPKSAIELKYADPELYLIVGNERFVPASPPRPHFATAEELAHHRAWADIFFQSPLCQSCGSASGPRSDQPLDLRYVPFRYDGGFGSLGGKRLEVVSRDFLDLLTAEERDRLAFRAVTCRNNGREFYELAGPAGPSFVAVQGLPTGGWRCETCGHGEWSYWFDDRAIHSFIARSDLPNPLPGLFTVGAPPSIHLCATAQRWKEIVGRKGATGFVSEALGVVPDSEVIREPNLPSREEAFAQPRRLS